MPLVVARTLRVCGVETRLDAFSLTMTIQASIETSLDAADTECPRHIVFPNMSSKLSFKYSQWYVLTDYSVMTEIADILEI